MERHTFTHDNRSKPQRGGVFQPGAIALGNGQHPVQSPERAEYKFIEQEFAMQTEASDIYTLLHYWARGKRTAGLAASHRTAGINPAVANPVVNLQQPGPQE
jgi:hypothetical protein